MATWLGALSHRHGTRAHYGGQGVWWESEEKRGERNVVRVHQKPSITPRALHVFLSQCEIDAVLAQPVPMEPECLVFMVNGCPCTAVDHAHLPPAAAKDSLCPCFNNQASNPQR